MTDAPQESGQPGAAADPALGGDAAFEALLVQLRDSRGFDFTGYKRASLARRVDRRLRQLELTSYAEYGDLLEVRQDEFTTLFNTILINVTSFFRDPQAWTYLSQEVVPGLLAARKPTDPVRVWSAGCASGQEAYTLAMIFAEVLGVEETRERVKIYATDVDEEALSEARGAVYSNLEGVPEELRTKYFEGPAGGQRHSFRSDLRRSVIFGRNDLVQDAPISRIDLLVCRNVLMYLNGETQGRVLSRFHFATTPAGALFLGKAEMLLSHGRFFTPLDLKQRVFRPAGTASGEVPRSEMVTSGVATATLERVELAQEALNAASNAQIVVDGESALAFVNVRAQRMFGISQRDVGKPFRDLELSYRPVELRGVIDDVVDKRHQVELRDVEWQRGSEEVAYLDVTAVPLTSADGRYLGTSITIADVTPQRRLRDGYELATRQLETAYEELQSTNEELETTNEELQSTVEELETTNEELQSTNEELETMNEELQSTNDELQSINDTLRDRTNELQTVRSLLDAVASNLHAGLIRVDADQRVQVWNSQAEEQWGLRADEAVGERFVELDIGLPVDQLSPLIDDVLGGARTSASLEVDAVNRRGRATVASVTITPLAGRNGESGGVLLVTEATS